MTILPAATGAISAATSAIEVYGTARTTMSAPETASRAVAAVLAPAAVATVRALSASRPANTTS